MQNYQIITLEENESIFIKGDNPNGFSKSENNYSSFIATGN